MHFRNIARKYGAKVAVIGGSLMAGSAFAAETGSDPYGIAAYVAAAQANVTLTVSGVIALAALGFGVGILVGWLRK